MDSAAATILELWNNLTRMGATATRDPDYKNLLPDASPIRGRGDKGLGSYMAKSTSGPDRGKMVSYYRQTIPSFQSEDQRRFVHATRRGAEQDPNFTPEEASSFIHSVPGYYKGGRT